MAQGKDVASPRGREVLSTLLFIQSPVTPRTDARYWGKPYGTGLPSSPGSLTLPGLGKHGETQV